MPGPNWPASPILFSGGDKKSQSRDIERAVKLLKDWEKRNG